MNVELDNEVLQTIKRRRATRAYSTQPVEKEKLQAIIEAGLYAPNAGSRQSPIIVACLDKTINEKLEDLNLQIVANQNRPAGHAVQVTKSESKPTEQKPKIFYDAPVLITIFAPKDWYNFTLDCAVAAENMLLAATSLGLGSNIIARAKETFETEYGRELQSQWGISEEYEAKLHVILGYALNKPENAHPRKADRVIIID